ncbi:MAG TPA: ATP-binding protein [Rhodothermales bacterium]|nr:ATP-binding protein [Rhodothermales bacterium]
MKLTFRTRLIILNVVTLALLLAATSVGLIWIMNRMAQRRFDSALRVIGVAEGGAVAERMIEHGLERPDDRAVTNRRYGELVGLDDRPLEKYVTVVDDGRRIADVSGNLTSPLPVDDALLERSFAGEVVYQTVEAEAAGRLRVAYVPVHGPSVPHPFVVLVGLPESLVGEHSGDYYVLIVVALVTLVKVTVLGSTLLARRAIRPLERITAAAESIDASTLSARLPEASAHDYIGRLAAVINRMLARLEASFEAQRRFTDRAAHELRTPLTILKGETQVALGRRRTPDEYEEILRSNLEEIEKMVLVIDNLLTLARYEGGQADLPCQDARLDTIAANVTDDLLSLASERGVRLDVSAAEPVVVRGDPLALERLVFNLVENAIYYTPRGGEAAVRVSRDGGRAALAVKDTGIGIADEELPQLYHRFFRSHAARRMRPEGTGIGLPVVAAIARLHGAEIDVRSAPGAGTTFVVSFPGNDFVPQGE